MVLLAATGLACADWGGETHVLSDSTVIEAAAPVEYRSEQKLRRVGWFTDVCLTPAAPVEVVMDSFALRVPDEPEVFVPQIELIETSGEATRLKYQSVLLGTSRSICLGLPWDSLVDEYAAVRITSPRELPVSKIWWSSRDK